MEKSFTFVIADIHGRFDLLSSALSKIESLPSTGTVVFLGDYIDRGPNSRQVVDRLRTGPTRGWTWICLKGNHEEMMVRAHRGMETSLWLGGGGLETVESYGGLVPDAHIEWCENLPTLHLDKHRVYVHAAVDTSLPPDPRIQRCSTLLWKRYAKEENPLYEHHIVHGHTPVCDGPTCLEGRTNLDIGAVYTGRMAIGVFDDQLAGGPVNVWYVE